MNDIYDKRRLWKLLFFIVALVVAGAFLYISNSLVKDLSEQERERMEIWANATKEIASTGMSENSFNSTNIDFLLSIIETNRNIPVLLVDDEDNILQYRNFKLPEPIDSMMPYYISPVNMVFLQDKLHTLQKTSNIITIHIDKDTVQRLFYEDSDILKRLSYYPYVQLIVMVVFILFVTFAVYRNCVV